MAQYNWLYLGENGRQYNVGLFHGDRTGHLMVMCNARIVLIDFSVQQSKEYSFFIDDELFELSVERQPGRYAYHCAINEQADTPRNRIRKKQKRLDFRKSVALITIFALVIIGALGFAMVAHKGPPAVDAATLLSQRGLETTTRIVLEAPQVVSYSFVADGRVREYRQALEMDSANGFPLETGDEFRLRYVAGQPGTHRLEWNRPTEQQLDRYLKRTIARHRTLNPELNRSQARCRVEVAYRLGGVEALAVVYHQNTPEAQHPLYNELTYKKFTRDVPFSEATDRECWK